MRLHRLTGLEQEKLTDEYGEILETVKELLHILSDPERLLEVIREELEAVTAQDTLATAAMEAHSRGAGLVERDAITALVQSTSPPAAEHLDRLEALTQQLQGTSGAQPG